MTAPYIQPTATNKLNQRQLRAQLDPISGDIVFAGNLTPSNCSDTVDCVVPTIRVLPIIFVPGIMGSNLKGTKDKFKGQPVWRLDGDGGMLFGHMFQKAGIRQIALHPDRTAVDDGGELPAKPLGALMSAAHFKARGWGEVGKTSYQAFLMWLEENLNGGGLDPKHPALNQVLMQVQDGRGQWGAKKSFAALSADEAHKAQQWFYPVHAFGYNWLDDNVKAAQALATRITAVKTLYKKRGICEQVILVTHSMGGLVARACSKMEGMEKTIAGIVHGVMPAVGAAVAYRRCKVGMWDEGASGLSLNPKHNLAVVSSAGAAAVIGKTGQEVTAVFAQAPGALQLLPTKQYPVSQWLKVVDSSGTPLPQQPPTVDPYGEGGVYRERKKWWGLIREEWLHPKGGEQIFWKDYEKCLKRAADFHDDLKDHFHPNTWGFYGSRVNSFESLTWTLETGDAPPAQTPSAQAVYNMEHKDIPLRGSNPEHIAGPPQTLAGLDGPIVVESTSTRLRLNTAKDSGDGTVPRASGAYPVNPALDAAVQQRIKQFFEVPDIEHEPAYKKLVTQQMTAYAIAKIAAALPLPKRA